MSQFKDLKLYPNMPEVRVQFAFNEPKSYDSKLEGGAKRYAYKLKLLSDFGEFRAGDEVTYWTSLEGQTSILNKYKRGDQVKLMYPQGAGERHATLVVKPLTLDEEPVYEPPTSVSSAPNGSQIDAADVMAEALVEGYTAIKAATGIIEERFDMEAALEFAAMMTTGDIVQKTGTSIYISKTQRR